MPDNTGDVLVIVNTQALMMRQFLSHLLWRLAHDVPGFRGDAFLEQLETAENNMPEADDDDPPDFQAQCEIALEEWSKLREMAEHIIAEARQTSRR